jgi:glycosyltransferase involved in cell wall biosynthesis
MKPTVSICIPTYNGSTYLPECLESALSQTYSDFELLIIDDCSSDNSVEIGKTYARRDSRIQVFVNDHNLGLVENWNRSVQLSRGEWVKFVFQDDLILPECLHRMLSVATKFATPIVSCARDFIFESNTTEERRQYYLNHQARVQASFRNSNQWSAQQCSEAALQRIGQNLLGEPTAVLLHHSVFERFGWFNPHLRNYCDSEYWIRVASNTGTVHIPEILAMFRVHGGAMSSYLRQTLLRRYRAETIDPLLIVHDYAFDPLYAGLRGVAANCQPGIDLPAEFWARAIGALWIARQAAHDPSQQDSSLLEEWRRVAHDYPRLTTIPLSARIRSKWRALKNTVLSSQAGRQKRHADHLIDR